MQQQKEEGHQQYVLLLHVHGRWRRGRRLHDFECAMPPFCVQHRRGIFVRVVGRDLDLDLCG